MVDGRIKRLPDTNGDAAQSAGYRTAVIRASPMLGTRGDKRNGCSNVHVNEYLGLQVPVFRSRQDEDAVMVIVFQNGGSGGGSDFGSGGVNVRECHDFFHEASRSLNRPVTQPDV